MAANDLSVPQNSIESVVTLQPRRYLDRLDLDGLRSSEPEVHTGPGTRGKVLDAAIDLFAYKGYNACSMRDIAKVVNIGAPAIYNYYASKSDILIASLDFVLSTFYSAVLKSPIPRHSEAALFCILRRHVLFGIMNRTFVRAADALLNKDLMRRELPENYRFRYSLAMEEYRKMLEELIRDVVGGKSSIDFALQAFLVHEMVDRAGEWYEPASPLNPADIADQCCEAVARMLELPSKSA